MKIFDDLFKPKVIIVDFCCNKEANGGQKDSIYLGEAHFFDIKMEDVHGDALGLWVDFEVRDESLEEGQTF